MKFSTGSDWKTRIFVVALFSTLGVRGQEGRTTEGDDLFDEIKIRWDDDVRHPRRLEPEIDYWQKAVDFADQFAAMVGGFDGVLNLTTFIHDEISEITGQMTPEQEERKKQRNIRLSTFLPLFETEKPKPASKEVYSFDLGKPDEQQKTHTAKDMLMDGALMLWSFLRGRNKTDAAKHVFDDEL